MGPRTRPAPPDRLAELNLTCGRAFVLVGRVPSGRITPRWRVDADGLEMPDGTAITVDRPPDGQARSTGIWTSARDAARRHASDYIVWQGGQTVEMDP